jgi:Xaa-Pro dipeptidase
MDIFERRRLVAAVLNEKGFDLLLCLAPAYRSFNDSNAVAFLADYRARGESALVLTSSGAATLIVTPASDAERVAARAAGLDHVAADDPVEAILAVLGSVARTGRIAVAGWDIFPVRHTERLAPAVGASPASFDAALYAAAGAKTEIELERARRATTIAEDGFRLLLETARPGMAEHELALVVNDHMKGLGADDNFTMLSSWPMSRGVMPPGGRRLQVGDLILAELTPSVDHQFVQICRAAVLGRPTRQLADIYDLVVRAMWNGIEQIRPGAEMADVCRGVDVVLEEAGYAEYCRPPYIHRRGHGVGAGSSAPFDVALDNHVELQPDMLFVVHPNQYLPETGYLLCGEPVRVTATGVEVLSSDTAALGIIDI